MNSCQNLTMDNPTSSNSNNNLEDDPNSSPSNRGLLMSYHSSPASLSSQSAIITPIATINTRSELQRRTVEDARRHLRDNFNTMLQPLVDTARYMNVANLLHHQTNANTQQTQNNVESNANANSTVINLDGNAPEPVVVNTENAQGNGAAQNTENIEVAAETQAALATLLRYVPFILILLVKSMYVHHEGILNFVILFITFVHCNNVVKKEATKGPKRKKSKLLLALLYSVICITFINYVFEEEKLYMHMILVHNYTKPLTVWDLLWFVGINDFMLKLVTIMVKILVTLQPGAIIQFKKRGKIYLAIESVSQLYRSLATSAPWLIYLTESYHNSLNIFGLILAAFYLIFKSVDIFTHIKFVKSSIQKLFQNISIGSSPSKDQIQSAGEHCPICHDQYDAPVLLQCRHIFCENCVTTWFDREQTCPLCRAKIVDDPSWRDGSTTFFLQLF